MFVFSARYIVVGAINKFNAFFAKAGGRLLNGECLPIKYTILYKW